MLQPGRLALRPGGCAWLDRAHVIVSSDLPETGEIGFAIFGAGDGTSVLMRGTGGEAPTASEVSLAFAARGPDRRLGVSIGPIPRPDEPVPPAQLRVVPEAGELDFYQPILSSDGRRLAVVELAPPDGADRLLVYDLGASASLALEIDITGATDAGPAWVADPGSG